MKALMNSWWKEFSFYSFWESYREPDWDEEDRNKPLISFSFETWKVETRPSTYGSYNDTGRWRGIHFRMYVSRYLIGLTIPYKKLPDHIPTKRQLEQRYRHAEHLKKLEEERNAVKKV